MNDHETLDVRAAAASDYAPAPPFDAARSQVWARLAEELASIDQTQARPS